MDSVIRSGALATASSGYVYKAVTNIAGQGWVDSCLMSVIADVADNRSYHRTHTQGNGCTGTVKTLPAGYISVKAFGYRDGLLCGQTGWSTHGAPSYFHAIGGVLWSNPTGSQEFYTLTHGRIWNGTSYTFIGTQLSPSQNY